MTIVIAVAVANAWFLSSTMEMTKRVIAIATEAISRRADFFCKALSLNPMDINWIMADRINTPIATHFKKGTIALMNSDSTIVSNVPQKMPIIKRVVMIMATIVSALKRNRPTDSFIFTFNTPTFFLRIFH